jgi:hypothetical protein
VEDEKEVEDGKGESEKFSPDVVVAISAESTKMIQNVNMAAFSNAMGAPAGARDEEELKARHGVDARPSLALHPDVSDREFLNES